MINEQKTNWSQHLEFMILLLTLLGTLLLIDSKVERQGQRTDKLYEMFIDLIKTTQK